MGEDLLIDNNLKLFKPLAYKVELWGLILPNGKNTSNRSNGLMISKLLIDKDLGEVIDDYFFLNEKGKEILKNGGWLKHIGQPNEKFKTLDNILLFIKEHPAIEYRTMLMMITDLNSPLKQVSSQEILSGIKKLVKDGFVEEKIFNINIGMDISNHRNETLYSISYDGIIFLESGGYFERERENHKKIIPEKATPPINDKTQDWTKSIKWNIAIGLFVTIFGALVVYAIIEIIKNFSKT